MFFAGSRWARVPVLTVGSKRYRALTLPRPGSL